MPEAVGETIDLPSVPHTRFPSYGTHHRDELIMQVLGPVKVALRRARLSQIRITARLLSVLHGSPRMVSIIRAARSLPFNRKVFDAIAGYRRVLPSMAEANAVATRYIEAGHGCLDNINRQIACGLATRPSDYPVLYHMDKLLPQATSLFDLGGNVGILFYCYSKYLDLPQHFIWLVYDITPTIEFGRKLAHERREHRLKFTDDLGAIRDHDVMLVSGSLHYLERSLPDVLRGLPKKPIHVIVNRAPMTNVKSVVTVQDADTYLVACKTILRRELIRGMEELGYDVVDHWSVPELWIRIPFYPEYSVPEYSGLYFRMRVGLEQSRSDEASGVETPADLSIISGPWP